MGLEVFSVLLFKKTHLWVTLYVLDISQPWQALKVS
jgi:hypothetical protein